MLCNICAIGQSFENWLDDMEAAKDLEAVLALIDSLFDGLATMFTGGWVKVADALADGLNFMDRDEFGRPVTALSTPAGRKVLLARIVHPLTGPWVGVNFNIR